MTDAARNQTDGVAQDAPETPAADAPETASAEQPSEEQPTAEPQPAADAPPATAPAGDVASGQEATAARERYLRLAAEFDNYKKRVERERSEAWNRAQAQLAEKLLDVLDDLQRVAHFAPETATAQALLEGAQMVERKLQRALESAGLEEVEAAGLAFDPSAHEALMAVPADSQEEDNTVADVFQKGYRFKGTLLRPARVRVKKYEG